jgi:small subunit ribosomal protein S8
VILKNAALAGRKTVRANKTKMVKSVAEVLKRLGFISEIKETDGYLEISLAYKNKSPILTDIKLVSKPGLRVYWDFKKIKDFRSRYVLIISTPKGIMSSKEALKEGLGGEVVAQVL